MNDVSAAKSPAASSTAAARAWDDVSGGRLASVYFLCGEPFERDRVFAEIRRQALGDAVASAFNLDVLEAKQATADAILTAARTLPMLGNKRLVVVRDAHEIATEQLERLLPYASDPSPRTVLVLLADKADLRLKFFQRLAKVAVVARFDPLKERDVPRWISAEAERRGITIEAGVGQRVAEAVGNDAGQLADALERLSLYAGPGTPVRVADVEELLAQTRQRSIFELTNAVGQGRRREAMLILRQMQSAREPALRIVVMLVRHMRQLWSVRELSSAGVTQKEIASRLGIHPFFVGDMVRQASRFDPPALRRIYRTLFELERDLKSSPLAQDALMDRALLRLCN